jgi:glycosyltransferase involved in cell wall biosynthesis
MHRELIKSNNIYFIFPYSKEKRGFCKTINYVETKTNIPYVKSILYIIRSFNIFRKLVNQNRIDVVITDYFSFFFPIFFLGRNNKPKFILDCRTPLFDEEQNKVSFQIKLWINELALWYNWKYHDGISLISEELYTRFKIITKGNIHRNYFIWPSGVNSKIFVPMNRKVINNNFDLFFHGGFSTNRGLIEFISAMPDILKIIPQAKLRLLGDGPIKQKLFELINIYSLNGTVEIVNSVKSDYVPKYIAESNCCILPYPKTEYWENNVPLKILEYMAMCKPIIATRLKIFERITNNEKFCVFIDNNSIENIVKGVKYAYDHYSALEQEGEKARKIILQKYEWSIIATGFDKYINLL